MLRKIVWMLLIVTCLMLALSTGAMAEKRVVRVMVWGKAENMEKNMGTLALTYPEFFNEVEVEVLVGGSGDNEVAEQIRLALASRESVADIIQLNYTQIPEFAEAGALEDLSAVIGPYADKLLGGAHVITQYKGQYVAFPYELKSKIMYYRKDIFDDCGVDPTQWKTVDQMIADGLMIQEKYPDHYIWNVNMERGFQGYDVYMTMTAFDSSFVDADGNYNLDENEGVRTALGILKKIMDSGICYDAGDFTPDWEKAFADGVLICQPLSMWMKTFLNGYAPDQAGLWTTCLWPEEIRKGSEAGGSVYVVPIFSNNKEDAMELMRLFRLEDKGSLAIFEGQNRTPVTKSAFNDETVRKGHYFFGPNTYLVEAEASSDENFAVFPYTPRAVAEMGIFNDWVSRYMLGEVSLDEALRNARADMENQIGNPFQ